MFFTPRFAAGRVVRALAVVATLPLFVALAHATIGTSLQMQLGNPSSATTDPTNHSHYLIQRPQYALDYSDGAREPNWVSWHLTTGDVGGSGRSAFQQDTTLPAGFYQVLTTDYSGSGYDRGHMCPSADRTITVADNQQVFYMSNMVPQAPDNNQGIWASFETYCRSLASAGNEVLIQCGPSGFGGSTIASGVAIPGYTWKIVLVVPIGPGSAVSRITNSTRVIAIKVPNIAGIRSTPWQNFVTSVAQIEADTGYTFLTELPASTRSALRTVIDGQTAAGAPAIAAQPTTQTTVVGGSATFAVTASGDAPLSYQWFKDDDQPVANGTAASLTLTNIQAADVGSYYVVVTNPLGSATSPAAQLVVLGLAPSITTSPASQTVNAGSTVTFAVAASGSPTLTYQWRKGGGNLAGATTSTLTLGNVQTADNGAYDVVVTNSTSSATSSAATLAVLDVAPTITVQPVAKAATTGSNASFSVAASGTAPLTYAWRKDGNPLSDGGAYSGTTSATLVISNVSAVNGGNYDVVVTNALGFATSTAATLTVNPPAPSTIYWDFGTTAAPTAAPTSGLPVDIVGGTVTQGNNNGTTLLLTTSSASTSYAGASGTVNIGAAARIGALNTAANGSAYFEFTLTPSAGKRLYLNGLSFGSRSTSTGPQAYSVFTSVDNFAAPVATGTLSANANWALQSPTITPVTGATGTGVTVRLYGFGGAGNASASTANWRVDDLKVQASTLFPPPDVPVVVSTTPAAGATAVPVSSGITVAFNEAVSFTGTWFNITSATQGAIAATVTGGPTTFTLTPPSYFPYNDTISVTVYRNKVVDQATGSIAGSGTTSFSFTTETYVPPTPPAVTTQPSAATAPVGGTASFTVAASGTAPLAYQWRKAGVAIAGNASAATATLTLSNLSLDDAGLYDCVVSNVAGSDVSHTALLTVQIVAPSIVTQPVSQMVSEGGSASFTIVAAGTAPFTYQWRKGGSPLLDGPTVAGASTATLTLSGLTYLDSGSYDVVVTNSANSVTSNPALLAVSATGANVIYWDFATATPTSGMPANVTGGQVTQGNNNGTTTMLTASAVSGSYTGASGGNNAGLAARVGALNQAAGGSAYYEVTFAPAAGRRFAITGLTFGARSTGTGPQAYTIFSSLDGYTSPLATGTLNNDSTWRLISPALRGVSGAAGTPVTLRIYGHGGTGSPGAGTANWRIDDLKIMAGLLAEAQPPVITTSPTTQTVTVGDNVSFTVAATGTGPLSYAWRKGGSPIAGNSSASTPTLTLTAVTTADAGDYDCVVTNIAGFATSATATLTVNKAPATVTLGSLAFTYDGAPHGASATTAPQGLTVTFTYDGSAVTPTNAGNYAVVATIDDANYSGTATGTLVIAKATAAVALDGLHRTFDGSPKAVTAATTPAGLTVLVTYNGSTTVPTNAGTYSVAAVVQSQNYVGSATGTLVIDQAPATITLSKLTQTYDGTPKPVVATTSPAGLDVVLTYDGSVNAPVYPGSYLVAAAIDDDNYTGTATARLVIGATATVRHAPVLNGGLEGSVQVLAPESVSLANSAYISGDLLVPGVPVVNVGNRAVYGGTIEGVGAATPSNHAITLTGGATLRHVVRRVDAIALPIVAAPLTPLGTRSVTLNQSAESAGEFATVRNLTLGSKAGIVAVPAGAYGDLAANGASGFALGVAGATEPAVYHLQSLTVSSGAQVQILGPVVIVLANGLSLDGSIGSAAHSEWLTLAVAAGDVTLSSKATIAGALIAPTSSVTVNGTLTGAVVSDRLTVSSNGLVENP